jgi:hypothetical protein
MECDGLYVKKMRSIGMYKMKQTSREEALQIASQILERAELERLSFAESEAKCGIRLEDSMTRIFLLILTHLSAVVFGMILAAIWLLGFPEWR